MSLADAAAAVATRDSIVPRALCRMIVSFVSALMKNAITVFLLAEMDERRRRVVELRTFAGLGLVEVA